MQTFKVPGLVIHDRHDTLIPYEGGATIAQNWPGAKFISTERLGHRRGLCSTEVTSCILDFLKIESRIVVDLSLIHKRVSGYYWI